MAQSATADSVSAADQGPDYEGAIALMRGEIRQAKEETSSLGQNVGQAWKRIEKTMGLNRKGAQMFNAILFLAPDTQKDIIRTFIGLLRASKLDRFDDLVDRAEQAGESETKPKPSPRKPGTKAAPAAEAPSHPADDSDLAGEDDGAIDAGGEDGASFDPETATQTAEAAAGSGFDDKGEQKGFTATEDEWNAAEQAAAAKAKVDAAGNGRPKLAAVK